MAEVAMRDTTFDNVVPTSVWLDYDNQIHGKDRFVITLNVNGIKKNILDFYIPGLAQDEGHTCGGTNLTWLYESLIKESAELKIQLADRSEKYKLFMDKGLDKLYLENQGLREQLITTQQQLLERDKTLDAQLAKVEMLLSGNGEQAIEILKLQQQLKSAVEVINYIQEMHPKHCTCWTCDKINAFLATLKKEKE